jgi:hypothetical protein
MSINMLAGECCFGERSGCPAFIMITLVNTHVEYGVGNVPERHPIVSEPCVYICVCVSVHARTVEHCG